MWVVYVNNSFVSTDPQNRGYIINHNGILLVSEQVLHRNEDIALNALTTLIYLITPETKDIITSPVIVSKVLHYKNSNNPRLRNLGTVFLEDHCSEDSIKNAENIKLQTIDIPIPTDL